MNRDAVGKLVRTLISTKCLVFTVVLTLLGNPYGNPLRAEDPVPEEKSQPVETAPTSPETEPVMAEVSAPASTETAAVTEPSSETAGAEAGGGTSAPGNVSLDFKDADILNVLRVLSLKSGVNIVAGPEVQGTVTIRLQDVPWEKALEVVLRTYGYIHEREGNIIRVTTKENLATEELITETFVLNYTTAVEVEAAIKDILSERGRIKSVSRANTVIVTDIPTNLYKIGQVIKNLDQSTPQVYIDAKIVRTQLDQNENLGINWNIAGMLTGAERPVTFPFTAPGGDTQKNILNNQILKQFYPGPAVTNTQAGGDVSSFPVAGGTGTTANPSASQFVFGTLDFRSFTAALGLLRGRTNTKIISNPRIVVLNNQTAKVQVGDQIPIPSFERNETTGSFVISGFTYRDTGVVLNVTPHINQTNEIMIDLKPEVSSKGSDVSFGTNQFQAPSFSTTSAQTQVMIRNGDTIAIGGLLRDNEKVQESAVPGLSKIPLIGRLFRNTTRESSTDTNSKVETIFFITVSIVDTQGGRILVQQGGASSGVVIQSKPQTTSQTPIQQHTL